MSYRFGFILDPHIASATPTGRFDDYWESVFNKLQEVIKIGKDRKWDALVMAGDIYNVKQMPFPKQNALIDLFRQITVYTIVGNHDIYYERLNTLPNTPLGNLLKSGAVKLLDQEFENVLTGVSYSPETVLPLAPSVPEGYPSILVCHAYMGAKKTGFKAEAGGWVTYPEVIEAGYDIVVSGHDHTEYPDKELENGAYVFRFGALTRGTSHEHNLHRAPQVLEISMDSDGWEHQYIEVPHKPAEDVFAYTDIAMKEENRNIKHFIKDLKAMATKELSSGNLTGILAQLDIPKEFLDYIRHYGTDFGITF